MSEGRTDSILCRICHGQDGLKFTTKDSEAIGIFRPGFLVYSQKPSGHGKRKASKTPFSGWVLHTASQFPNNGKSVESTKQPGLPFSQATTMIGFSETGFLKGYILKPPCFTAEWTCVMFNDFDQWPEPSSFRAKF